MKKLFLAYSRSAVPPKDLVRFNAKLHTLRKYLELERKFEVIMSDADPDCKQQHGLGVYWDEPRRCPVPCDRIVVLAEYPYPNVRYEFADVVNATTGKSEKETGDEADSVPVICLLDKDVSSSAISIGLCNQKSYTPIRYTQLCVSILRGELDKYFTSTA